jgi:hypothetical protein
VKIFLQRTADPAHLAIEQERLKIEKARFEATEERRKQKAPFAQYLRENLLAFVAVLVSVATLALSASQVLVAEINKNKDLAVLEAQQEREWRYKALEFVANKSEIFFGTDADKAKQMAAVFTVGFPQHIAVEILGKIQNSAKDNVLQAIYNVRDQMQRFEYLDWKEQPREAIIQGETFLTAPKERKHETTTVKSLQYLTWDGSKWEAVIENGTFRHMPYGDPNRSHPDTILNYLNWQKAPSTKSLFGR